ncbi:hypothetical protein LUZ63_022107 [Rhynchospora breviuscula]|uniref:Glutamine amidotransferase type-2 domain-containing protein n=1 Tax=Rhynchospora breviuscula TaxID=2022672 RepID=A0A9Q0BY73_9POAL|nr:hypothetical protein LUZ63_022107 [Rhynchospora breviuscula]
MTPDYGLMRHMGIGLGHRRLSIIDLSVAGHQPMPSASGRYQMVYNGEITITACCAANSRIWARLRPGAPFRYGSHSGGLRGLGIEAALPRLNGMFAIAVWDRQRGVLTLACDPFGEKPLYYGIQGGRTLLFGSELKALYAHPAFAGTINRDALALYLRHNYIPAPHSIWEGIAKLEPGHSVEIRPEYPYHDCEALLGAYTTLWSGRAPIRLPDAPETVDQLEALLMDAVGLRMDADVPVGAFLSGGIESSLITALMQAQSSGRSRRSPSDLRIPSSTKPTMRGRLRRILGTEHTELVARPQDALDLITRLPAIWDEPFSDSSQIPTFLVSQLTRQHVTVCLSGDAGDELFGGYNRYIMAQRLGSLTRPSPARYAISPQPAWIRRLRARSFVLSVPCCPRRIAESAARPTAKGRRGSALQRSRRALPSPDLARHDA